MDPESPAILYLASLDPGTKDELTTEESNKREQKGKNLIRPGVDPVMAFHWSRTRMGGWAVAKSPILGTTITLSRLQKRGYEDMLSHYGKIAPHLNEPLYARPPESFRDQA